MTFSYLLKEHPQVLIIYRNTPPGVMNHRLYFDSPPLSEPQDTSIMPYHWGTISGIQNELIERMIHEEFPSILYLNVATPSSYLVHRHNDEVHVCSLGQAPHNIWILLLYNAFLLIEDGIHEKRKKYK